MTEYTSDTNQPDPTESQVPVVSLVGVDKVFDTGIRTQVLFDINLQVMPGEFVAIVGSSGSGKTTLLNILGLLDTPTEGQVMINGQNTAHLTDDQRSILRRDYLGFIFQFHYLLPEFNVLENVLMPCRIKGKDVEDQNRDRMVALLDKIGLKERLYYRPSQISGGQQQRAAMLRALANNPVLVLADEPTGNLDSKSGDTVIGLMRDLNKSTGTAFIIVTHDRTFAQQTNRVIELVDGRIQSDTLTGA